MNELHLALLRHNAQVPRYTSYPSAPHFGVADIESHYTSLAGLGGTAPISLYVHIPFCKEMCWYCGCNTSATKKYAPVEDYMTLLLREVRLLHETIGARLPVAHLHFGGGSPNMLSPEDFLRLLDALRVYFDFKEDAEIALEADPRGISHDRAYAYAQAGVNRGSFGIQDFSPVVQAAINRMQPAVLVQRAVDIFRTAGISDINFDLMYGLPRQLCEDIAATVEKSVALAPSRIALFGYAHVPWMKKHMRLIRDEDLPDASERLRQFTLAEQMLVTAEFVPVGIDHFVRADDIMRHAHDERRLARNFQGYTTDKATTLLGIGASSISRLPGGFAQNATTVTEYGASILDGRLPVAKSYTLTADDRLRAGIISDIMCYLECDIALHLAQADAPPDTFAGVMAGLQDLIDDGLVWRDEYRVGVVPAVRQAARLVAARFDAHLQIAAKRHVQVA